MRRLPVLLALIACALVQAGCAATGFDRTAASGYPAPVGAVFRDQPASPLLVVIPAGAFMMGSAEAETRREGRQAETAAFERPQHRVRVARPLAVGRYLVTRGEYAAFMTATVREPSNACNVLDGRWQLEPGRSYLDTASPQTQTDLNPASCIAVADAEAYAAWLSESTGHSYRLLHEAEWEYAARGGSSASRWWGDSVDMLCRYANGADRSYDHAYPGDDKVNTRCDDGFVQSNPVGAFPPNPFGLYDMLGNLWEWTADCFVASYAHASSDASTAVADGDCSRRSIRGASWHNHPDALRSAARFSLPADMHSSSLGFRILRLPDPPK